MPASGPASSSGLETPDEIPRAPSEPAGHGFPMPRFPNHFRGPRRYEILGEHGRGGLGKVSRAFDRKLGRDVAIKELHSRGTGSEVRFLREVLITARLEHPGIVPIHEAGRWPDGTPYYAMKLVSGRSLRELIAERPTFEQRIGLLHHVIAVADAIAYAHGRNIIHRDLKPANVIVGDFGETIVIDWGLAKDLTTADLAPDDHDDFASSHDSELTIEGAVVGTPAYMAPEQKRGEAVDQRADVFAIGTMLWELCAVQKVPPKAHLRTRMLRRAGVDADFAAIVNKALDPDRERRYPDAGALVADLKAFKSGARITARDYTFFAMLAHWTRRHRTLALSALAVLLLAVAGSLVYVRNIAVERDRADRSLDELTLKHAELLIATDPSAALDALLDYRGADRLRADQIRAQAVGLGAAFLRTTPHTEAIRWLDSAPDGSIISLSSDGTIARTYLDGTSSVLTRGVSKIAMTTSARTRHLLAYTCDPSDLCLLDILRGTRTPLAATLHGLAVNGASFSPDGALLAVLCADSAVRLLDVSDPTHPAVRLVKQVGGSRDVIFVDASVLAVASETGVEFIRLTGDSETLSLPDLSRWVASPSEHKLAVSIRNGPAVVLESFPARIAAKADLCGGTITNLDYVGQRIAYACREGAVGLWDLRLGTVQRRAQLENHADFVAASPTGEYVVAAGGDGVVMLIDLATDLVASYKGHGFRVTALAPPTADRPFLVSADVRGSIRAWPVPPRFAHVAATSSSPFNTAVFARDSTAAVATTWAPTLLTVSASTGPRTIASHEKFNSALEASHSGRTFATYGLQDAVEVWFWATLTRTRVIPTAHGSVTQLRFVDDTDEFITSGNDGRLLRWTDAGGQVLVAQASQPIDNFASTSAREPMVFSTVDGALWRTGDGGQASLIRPPGARVNRIVAAHDPSRVYVGYASGDVVSIDTTSWQQQTVLRGVGSVRELAITEDSRRIAVLTSAGDIHVGTIAGAATPASSAWTILLMRARDIAFAHDGLLLASCPDGTLWLYSATRQRWLCLPLRTGDLGKTSVSPNGKFAVALDREGRLIWIDLEAARKLLDTTPNT